MWSETDTHHRTIFIVFIELALVGSESRSTACPVSSRDSGLSVDFLDNKFHMIRLTVLSAVA